MVILFWVKRKYVICNSCNFNFQTKVWITTLAQNNLNPKIQLVTIPNSSLSFRHLCDKDNWLNSEILFTGGFPRPRLRRWGEDGPVQSHVCCHAVRQHEIQTETQGRTGWSQWNCWCREGKCMAFQKTVPKHQFYSSLYLAAFCTENQYSCNLGCIYTEWQRR